MCEPLRGKIIKCGETMEFNDGMTIFASGDVKSAVEFYRKYEGKPEFFTRFNLENEWWQKNKNEFKELNNTMISSSNYYKEHYALQNLVSDFNKWLYKYSFQDVTE